MTPPLVVVGASWGGSAALARLLGLLGDDVGFAVGVVLHRAPGSSEWALPGHLQRHSQLQVSEATDKEPFRAGHVCVAPGDYHLLVETDCFSLDVEDPVSHSRPSVDVLFETAAHSLGSSVTAVVLTGNGRDGAAGITAVARVGGVTVAQDPAEAERPEIPSAAIGTGAVTHVLPLAGIADLLLRLHVRQRR
jgi:two-component system, chemotaxis family, protein-glutamate methylesterase/glutaminase